MVEYLGKVNLGKIVLYNDIHISPSFLRFVDQEDIHLATVTVREAVLFSALLRLPESISREEKEARVDDILKKMGLSHVSNSRIGGTCKQKGKYVMSEN